MKCITLSLLGLLFSFGVQADSVDIIPNQVADDSKNNRQFFPSLWSGCDTH